MITWPFLSNLFTILNRLQLLFWSVLVFDKHISNRIFAYKSATSHWKWSFLENSHHFSKNSQTLSKHMVGYQNDRYLKCTPKWPLFNAPLNYRSFCLARIPKWPSDYQNDRCSKWPFSKMTVNLAPNDRYTKITVILY